MEFKELKSGEGLLTERELNEISGLIYKGNALLKSLSNECTYEKLRKSIIKYAREVNSKRNIIEQAIERTLKVKPSLSVKINELIINVQELIDSLKKATVINRYSDRIINNITLYLARNKVFIQPLTINYRNGRTLIDKKKITLGFEDLSIHSLVKLILQANNETINEKFLINELDLQGNMIMHEFKKTINEEELKISIKNDPSNDELLIKIYILLKELKNKVEGLKDKVNNSIYDSENELKAGSALINQEIKKLSNDLIQGIKAVSSIRQKGVITQRLLSPYIEQELISNSDEIIKSYLRMNYEISNLIDILTYEFLIIYESIPDELSNYAEFKQRSKYELLKELFSKKN